MGLNSLHALLVAELRDLYSAEKQILKALPKLIKAVTSEDLRAGLQDHLEETREQLARLEQIGSTLPAKLTGHTCEAMKGLVEEGAHLLEEESTPEVLDAAIIGACQRVEHYEIAGYGTARAFAQALGLKDVANTLQATLDEEGNANKALTKLSKKVNKAALQA